MLLQEAKGERGDPAGYLPVGQRALCEISAARFLRELCSLKGFSFLQPPSLGCGASATQLNFCYCCKSAACK